MNFIPPEDEGRLRAAASGVLPNGKPIVVNADGTVSVVGGTAQSLGSKVVFDTSDLNQYMAATFDSNSNKVVILYSDGGNSNIGTAVVGTVSGSSISFGTAVTINSGYITFPDAVFDTNSNKVVIVYTDGGNSEYGTARVGTISGTNISFGTAAVFNSAASVFCSAAFDSNSNKVVIAYKLNTGAGKTSQGIVGTVSGTNISFGSVASFGNVEPYFTNSTFDSTNNKVVIVYRNNDAADGSYAVVATVSGTNVSFGTPVKFTAENTLQYHSVTFDSNAGKVVIAFRGASTYGAAIVGTVSGTGISFGTAVVFQASAISFISATFDSNLNKVVIGFNPSSTTKATFISGTVSGTSISFGSSIDAASTSGVVFANSCLVFDSNSNKVVLPFENDADSDKGTAVVYTAGNLNLTAENYVGMSGGPDKSLPATLGTGVVFESAATSIIGCTFDSNSNRIVISYRDDANSDYGTAVVGTVSGTSISFGTPVVFESAAYSQANEGITFDSNSNKVVIAYNDSGNNQYATAIVGTVNPANNSISFGSAAVFNSASTDLVTSTFDSNSNKVVICFSQGGGKAIVATVSGTSISFGSVVVFESGSTSAIGLAFDSTSNKVVIAFQDAGDSNKGKAIVGTVSGTNISFGTAAIFYNNELSGTAPVYDPSNNKTGIFFRKGNVSSSAFVVGTVSGTNISFGSEVALPDHMAANQTAHFDSQRNLCIATYTRSGDAAVSYYSASISGTSATIASPVVIALGTNILPASTFDSSAGKSVCAFRRNNSNSSDRFGTAIVFNAAVSNNGQVASGSSASVDIIGTVSTNQTGLTPGQSYFVQTDGTIGLTAGTPSVFAGTAISATKLLVKT